MFKLKVNSCDGVYSNSLDVRFTRVCDNNCSFCIERFGRPNGVLDVDKMVESTKKSGKSEVLILGGEPLLNLGALLGYVYGVRAYVDKIYITTSLPKIEDMSKFWYLYDLIDGLNVSLQHYDDKINNEVLNSKNPYNRVEFLKHLISECNRLGKPNKFRVSINLVKGYIDSRGSIRYFLDTMYSMGVKWVKINELQHSADDEYVSFERVCGYKLSSPYAHGCQVGLPLDEYSGMRITLKRSCFCVNSSLKANFSDFCKVLVKSMLPKCKKSHMVLYEDGNLSKGWVLSSDLEKSSQ